jgi:aspartyl-tRNA(Asn)/glutamyl-tRNA(Gln) amidotransferase subunit C
MNEDPKLVEHLAKLARLNLTTAEKKEFGEQIPKILDYGGQLKNAAIAPQPPSDNPPTEFRTDQVTPSDNGPDILSQAPEHQDDFWKVHSVF